MKTTDSFLRDWQKRKESLRKSADDRKKTLCERLKQAEVHIATISFSGSGDEGGIDTIEFDPAAVGTEEELKSLRKEVEQLAYDYLEAVIPGWEINDGGDGILVLVVKTQILTLHHNSNYTEQVSQEYKL
jgi:hypothetical protein